MALSQNDEQLLQLLLKERQQIIVEKKHKPIRIKVLQFSMVSLSLLLFIAVGTLGILVFSKPSTAAASNTYTETWTATNGIYTTPSGGQTPGDAYTTGIPANGKNAGSGSGPEAVGELSAMFTVTAWTVSGTIN